MIINWKNKFHQTSTSVFIYIFTLLLCKFQECTQQLVIKSINVPPLVHAGEVDYVILDCDYDLKNISTEGLVVKWFYNYDNVEYQWIYGSEPQADPSSSHIDVGYKASDDPVTMYRAMKLNNPTINLTGDYRCAVFTFEDEQIANASMIVYSTEEIFDLKHRKKIVDGKERVEVTCNAEGLYPQPSMDITVNDVPLNETETPDLTMREDGKYDIMTQVSIMDEDLPRISLIKCTLSIPIANYTNPREFTYYTAAGASILSKNILFIIIPIFGVIGNH
ncbi:uncharacterized protein LOC122857958 isoform X2 [Aphidius gifuensis]|uniref:uncharacterized protein LOC122857958 isoform X2 n=1 Tax=Aphidius gifuensis TaxID=684658 RepID=UPI001CDCC6A0|nr:uncharacterized protein LOC122857958 isoform X2 [Aphidius gifuensis]